MLLSSGLAPVAGAARALGAACSVLAVVCLAACEVTDDARLLSLTDVEPTELALGDALRVRGQGFPTGADSRVRLHGDLWQAGRAPRAVDVTLSARAVSGDEIVAVVERDALPTIEAHATFHGRLSVSFAAAAGASRVSGGIENVTLDVMRADEDLAHRYEQLRHAQETLRTLGIVLEDESRADGGLVVRWAREGSVAAMAGVQQGDLLTHVGGLRLRSIGDFAPAPGASTLEVRLRPSSHPAERVIELSLASVARPLLARAWVIVSLVAIFVVGCLVWLAPLPRRLVRFRSPVADVDSGDASRPSSTSLTDATARRLVPVLLWPLVASLFWIALAVAQRWGVSVHVLVLTALVGAAHLVTSVSLDRAGDRLVAWARELNLLLLVVAALGCAALLAGSLTVAGIVERQGGVPWQWFAFKAPPLLLACLVFMTASRRLVDRSRVRSQTTSIALSIVLAGLGAAVFLGGWQPIGAGLMPLVDPAVFGMVAYAAKAWILMLLLILPQRRNVPVLSTAAWTSVAFAGIALSVLWLRLSIAPAVELTVGYSLCGASVVVAMLRAWRVQRASMRAQ